MQMNKYALGIDTSNYTTSVAVVDSKGNILCDLRKLLSVKQGEKGLRQSYALFQHVETLPGLFAEAVKGKTAKFQAVAVSSRPRPLDGSYMPVFKAGESFAMVAAAALDAPLFTFSHQEGHIEAARQGTHLEGMEPFLCYHLSGGTCELLKVSYGNIVQIGGSKDISFGQVLDRIGVLLGLSFPCGAPLDKMALCANEESRVLKEIAYSGLWINLSGLETQVAKVLQGSCSDLEVAQLIREMFRKIGNCILRLTKDAACQTSIKKVLFAGGVSESQFLRRELSVSLKKVGIDAEFGKAGLSADNAVGIALLGGKNVWQ